MNLPQTAEYALRAMAHIATLERGQAIRSRDLSVVSEVPSHYLSKILRKLVTAGLLESQKGHGGGFVLAKPPGDVRFIDIFAAVGMELTPNRCAFGWGGCDLEHPCPLHAAWSRYVERIWEWATNTTLEAIEIPDEHTTESLRAARTKAPEE